MTNERQDRPYTVGFGCYGASRGSTVAALTEAALRHRGVQDSKPRVSVFGFGHPKFMEGKVDHPISNESLEALAEVQDPIAKEAVEVLRSHGRKPATAETLRSCDAVYAADDFIMGQYQDLASERGSDRYRTMLQGADVSHPRYGVDIDDIESPIEFVQRVVIPKKQGKQPNPVVFGGKPSFNPKDYPWYSLQGTQYRAGDKEARVAAAKDMVNIAYKLAERVEKDSRS